MDTFNSLIKNKEKGYLRGLNLGASLEEVFEIEGPNNAQKKKKFNHLSYEFELSDNEKVKIVYSANHKKRVVTKVNLLYYFYLFNEYEKLKNPKSLVAYMHQNGTDEILSKPNQTLSLFIKHYSERFGEPEIVKGKKGIYTEYYYDWEDHKIDEPVLVRIIYYYDDEMPTEEDSRQTIQIIITKL